MEQKQDENIYFLLNEDENENEDLEKNQNFFNDFKNQDFINNEILYYNNHNSNEKIDNIYSQFVHYRENYVLSQIHQICEYYGIAKEMKKNKLNKDDVIYLLVNYENTIENKNIVFKRKQLWYYINELKNDTFMKKFIIF